MTDPRPKDQSREQTIRERHEPGSMLAYADPRDLPKMSAMMDDIQFLLTTLDHTRKVAREALEFYADEENWSFPEWGTVDNIWRGHLDGKHVDGHKIARRALKELEGDE